MPTQKPSRCSCHSSLTSSQYVRTAAVYQLKKLKDPRVPPLLLFLLDDPDWMVREAVIKTLGQVNDPQSIPLLIPLITDSSWYVRSAAVHTLRLLIEV